MKTTIAITAGIVAAVSFVIIAIAAAVETLVRGKHALADLED